MSSKQKEEIKVAKKKKQVRQAELHIYKEDQFAGQDEPEKYILSQFSNEITDVIKPFGTFGISRVIELRNNDNTYSIYIGKIDNGIIDGVDYSAQGHEVFDKLFNEFFYFIH